MIDIKRNPLTLSLMLLGTIGGLPRGLWALHGSSRGHLKIFSYLLTKLCFIEQLLGCPNGKYLPHVGGLCCPNGKCPQRVPKDDAEGLVLPG